MDARAIIRMRQTIGLKLFGLSESEWRKREETALEGVIQGAIQLYIKQNGRAPPNSEIEKYRRASVQNDRPTDLQSITVHNLLVKLLSETIDVANEMEQWNKATPIIASELAGEINGFCFSKSNEIAIMIDETALVFCHLLAKIVAYAIFLPAKNGGTISFGKDHLKSRLAKDPLGNKRFKELFCAYVEHGTTSAAPQYWIDHRYDAVVSVLRDAMEQFIVAHECGHVYHRHFEDKWMMLGNDLSSLTQMINDKQPVYLYRHQKELEADGFGLNVIVNSIDWNDQLSHFRILGPILFFLGLETLDRFIFFGLTGRDRWAEFHDAIGSISGSYMIPSTHPAPGVRRHLLLQSIEKSSLPPQLRNLVRNLDHGLSVAFLEAEKMSQQELTRETRSLSVHPKWQNKVLEYELQTQLGKDIAQKIGGADNSN